MVVVHRVKLWSQQQVRCVHVSIPDGLVPRTAFSHCLRAVLFRFGSQFCQLLLQRNNGKVVASDEMWVVRLTARSHTHTDTYIHTQTHTGGYKSTWHSSTAQHCARNTHHGIHLDGVSNQKVNQKLHSSRPGATQWCGVKCAVAANTSPLH